MLRPGALGDSLLCLPSLRALRRRFPEAHVTLAGDAPAAKLLEYSGEIDVGASFDDPAWGWLFGTGIPPADQCPEVLVAWLREGSLAPRLEARSGPCAPLLITHPGRPPVGSDVHCARFLMRALKPLGISPTMDAEILRVPPAPSDDILVHPGSGSQAKNWPPDRFAVLIDILHRLGAHVRLVVGEADGASAAALDRSCGARLPRLEMPSLPDLAAQLAGCRSFVGNDSGVSHLAGLVGAPASVLFGPTSPKVWCPLGPRVRTFSFDVAEAEVADSLIY